MPNPNVGLGAALILSVPGIAMAASGAGTVDCDDCYRCTQYDGNSSCIGECVYDINYCAGNECEDGYEFNYATGKCEPAEECALECEAGCTLNESACECECEEEPDCGSGGYVDDSGECAECPYVNVVAGDSCIGSDGQNLDSCYLSSGQNCKFSDDTGIFEVKENCLY